jgi:acetyltransferase
MNRKLKNFFYPQSICIVGASSKEKSIGYEILSSIKKYKFKGKTYPVNPKSKSILDYKCYASITEIKENIDLAIIVVPKQFVDQSVDELIKKNVKSIILITAGFRETGNEGKQHEENLLRKLKDNDVRLVGPNCMGVINTLDAIKLNATFVAEEPVKGGLAFLSQSGALGAAVLNSLRQTDIRFAHFISVGNKADISEIDLLRFWLEDDNIKVITCYLESIEDGLGLIKTYLSAENRKPIIILKAGKTESGMRAASSHTGALSNNEKITDELFRQFGIIRAATLNEMFNTAKGFEDFPLPKSNRVAVITNAGGPAILAVDKLEELGLSLANITHLTKEKLKEIVHQEGSVQNPIDLLPGGSAEIYKKVNEIVLDDKNVDAVISIFVEPVMVSAFEVIESVNSIESDKPIYQVCMPLPEFWSKYREKSVTKRPIFKNPEDPAEIISNILLYENKKNIQIDLDKESSDKDLGLINPGFLNQNEVEKICKKYNLPIIESQIINLDQLKNFNEFNFPVVAKGIGKGVVHKSDLDAVKLNLKSGEELLNAVKEIRNSFEENNFELEEVLIQPFIKMKHELLIGGFRDNSFGPVVMFGTGGKYVEVWDDTKIKSAYFNDNDLEEMINETKIGKILKGVRGEAAADIDKIKNQISSVAKLLIENQNIDEIDINPLIVDHQFNLHAVDVRIKVK